MMVGYTQWRNNLLDLLYPETTSNFEQQYPLLQTSSSNCTFCKTGTIRVQTFATTYIREQVVEEIEESPYEIEEISHGSLAVETNEYDDVLNVFDWDKFEEEYSVDTTENDGLKYIHFADKKRITCTNCSLELELGVEQKLTDVADEDDAAIMSARQHRKIARNNAYGQAPISSTDSQVHGDIDWSGFDGSINSWSIANDSTDDDNKFFLSKSQSERLRKEFDR